MVSGIFSSTWRAMKCQEYQGNVRQQGAEYILGPGSAFLQRHEFVYVEKVGGGGDRFSEKAANLSQNMLIENGFNAFKNFISAMFIYEYFWVQRSCFLNTNQKNVIYFKFFSGEEVHFMHICESSTDQTPINDLLQLAGVKQVSFPNDTRVIDV